MALFPNIPDEIGRECLLRVSYKSHYKLRAVCKSWAAVVNSPRFYSDRKSLGISEQVICLVQPCPIRKSTNHRRSPLAYGVTTYDPARNVWKRLPPISTRLPSNPLIRCISFNHKLLIFITCRLGTRSVYVYDFSCNRWQRGADMPALRYCYALSASSRGLVYVAGGRDCHQNLVGDAQVYDIHNDRWEILPDMNALRTHCCGDFVGGKFYVTGQTSAEWLDPETKTWTTIDNMWSGDGCLDCFVAAFGRLFAFGRKGSVMEYERERNEWRAVGCMPRRVMEVTSATVWRDRILLCVRALFCELYVYRPPERGAKGSHNDWIAIKSEDQYRKHVQAAATVDV